MLFHAFLSQFIISSQIYEKNKQRGFRKASCIVRLLFVLRWWFCCCTKIKQGLSIFESLGKDKEALFNVAYHVKDNIYSRAIL